MANSTRRIRRGSASGAPRPRGRFAVAVTAGAVLVALAYQFAFATGRVGYVPDYGPTTDTGDTSGEGQGHGSAGRGGSGSARSFLGGPATYTGVGALAVGAATECTQTLPSLASTDPTHIVEVKLVADEASLEAGTTSCFHLRGRSATDNQWYDLTQRPETKIELESAGSGLVRQEGSGHRFALPITAAAGVEGRTVKVRARYEVAGAEALTSATEVTLHAAR